MKLISEIVQQHIINEMNVSMTILEVGPVINEKQSVLFCNHRWIKLLKYVTIGELTATISHYNNEYVVFDILAPEQEFTLQSVVTLQRPLLFSGTLSNTKLEWTTLKTFEKEKLPFVWLVSPTQEKHYGQGAGVGRNSSCKFWFVGWSDWKTKNAARLSDSIKPLFYLIEEFRDTIDRMSYVFEGYDSFSTRDFPKFGTEGLNGTEKTIFDSTLAAVEMDITVNIFATYCQNC